MTLNAVNIISLITVITAIQQHHNDASIIILFFCSAPQPSLLAWRDASQPQGAAILIYRSQADWQKESMHNLAINSRSAGDCERVWVPVWIYSFHTRSILLHILLRQAAAAAFILCERKGAEHLPARRNCSGVRLPRWGEGGGGEIRFIAEAREIRLGGNSLRWKYWQGDSVLYQAGLAFAIPSLCLDVSGDVSVCVKRNIISVMLVSLCMNVRGLYFSYNSRVSVETFASASKYKVN